MDLVLIRHARAQTGSADPPLDEQGQAQARRLAEWLAGGERLDGLWSSPARRARETAAAIAAAEDLTIDIDDGLAELDREETYLPLEERRAAIVARGYIDDAGFVPRVLDAVARVVTANAGRRVAVVAHGGVINVYLSAVLGLASPVFFEPRPASISRVVVARSGQRTVVSLNETGHLRGLPG